MSAKNLGKTGVLFTERRDFYISPQVTKELWTAVTPFTTILSNRRYDTGLKDPEFKLFEHRSPFVKQQFLQADATASLLTTATEIAIDNVEGLNSTVDDSYIGLEVKVWNPADTSAPVGTALITAQDTAGKVSMKSLTGSAFTVANNYVYEVVGNAYGEGTEAGEAWADELTTVWNSCQIFKTPIEITGTLYEAALRGYSNELARLRMEKNKEHKIQKEKAFLYGASPVGTNMDAGGTFSTAWQTDANSKSVRTTTGLITAIEAYGDSSGADQSIFDINAATYAYSDFVDDMEKVFQYVPENGVKTALVGGTALSYWSKIDGSAGIVGQSNWTVNMSDIKKDSLGFNFRLLDTPHGTLKLVWAPVLRGYRAGNMVVISDENLSLKQYRPSKFQANIKTDNAYDGVKDQYFSDEGVGIELIESHKLFRIG